MTWTTHVASRLAAINAAGQLRSIRALDGVGPVFILEDGREVVSFASNDYLGLSQHASVRAAAIDAVTQFGAGAGAARLVVGDRPLHRSLEESLAKWTRAESALLFPTGYAANLGVLGAFADASTLIVSDALNHASIVDGCRLSRGRVAVAKHRDVSHVASLLRDHDGRAIVVSDVVFSMDGDVADVAGLGDVCSSFGALLVLDEAHSVLTPAIDVPCEVLRVGTLSKTLGALGGFVAGPKSFISLVVNAARPFIFTTAPTPADTGAGGAALAVLQSPDGAALVARLRSLVERVAPGHPSPIIPLILGPEDAAVSASQRLLDDFGLLVPAIRPPTVPPGTSRLRVALSAAHTDDQIELLIKALAALTP